MQKDRCFFLNGKAPIIVLRRSAAIGDVVASTAVADKIIEQGFNVVFQAHSGVHCVLRRHPGIIDIAEPRSAPHVNLDECYEKDPNRKTRHFNEMFMESANNQLRARGIYIGEPRNCTPKLVLRESDRQASGNFLVAYPKPWIFIVPRSNAWAARTVSDGVWSQAARQMKGTTFWLGTHPGPPGIVDLKVRHFDTLMQWLSAADLLVTVDTGPMHVAAAFGIPILALGQASSPDLHLTDQRDFQTIWPEGLGCLNCQANICPKNAWQPPCQAFDPAKIAAAVNKRFSTEVSAAIAVYQPEVGVLNQCLERVLPQVDEVVVCRDMAGKFPPGALQHPKIRYVIKSAFDKGYGPKSNFACRHTFGKWILQLNDDCFLDEHAVARMKEVAKPDTGIVANLLRHSDGRIQHAGKMRGPNDRGWGHIDLGKFHPTFTEPTELENVCGACILVRRKAHYDAGGFDERYKFCCDDDHLCMSVRRAGWRIIFNPHSTAVHLEHQSLNKTANWWAEMEKSNKLFGQIWSRYFDHNKGNQMGNFDYEKA